MHEPSDYVLSNARVALADRAIEHGWVAVADGRIAEIGEGEPPERGFDLKRDLLIPGRVELHTDHLEARYVPRPKVTWDAVSAVVSYDNQLATSGITTVLDSLRVWKEERGAAEVSGDAEILADAIERAQDADLLRAECRRNCPLASPARPKQPNEERRDGQPYEDDGDHAGPACRLLASGRFGSELPHQVIRDELHGEQNAGRDDNHVVQVAEHRDEVRDEVNRAERISGDGTGRELRVPGCAPVAGCQPKGNHVPLHVARPLPQ